MKSKGERAIQKLTLAFVSSDVMTFLIQAVGGGLIVSPNQTQEQIGVHVCLLPWPLSIPLNLFSKRSSSLVWCSSWCRSLYLAVSTFASYTGYMPSSTVYGNVTRGSHGIMIGGLWPLPWLSVASVSLLSGICITPIAQEHEGMSV